MVVEPARLLTCEQFAARPDDGHCYELIDGLVVKTPTPSHRHQCLALKLAQALREFLADHPAGGVFRPPFDVVLPDAHQTFHPDLLFIGTARRDILSRQGAHGAPDLVMEVLCPETQIYDLGVKKAAYERAGVQEYWVVWQDLPRVEIFRLDAAARYGNPVLLEAGDTITTALLPGFALELDELYADPSAFE